MGGIRYMSYEKMEILRAMRNKSKVSLNPWKYSMLEIVKCYKYPQSEGRAHLWVYI